MLRSLPKSNKRFFGRLFLRCRCACLVGNLVVGLSFPFSPKFHTSLNVEFYNWRPTLACPRPDDSCLLRLVWLASLLQQVSCHLCVIFFFPVQRFLHSPAFPCCLKPHLPFPVSWFFHSLFVFAFFLPCVRSPVVWFGSSFLSTPRAFSLAQRKKIFFSTFLSVLLLCYCRPFVLSFDCPHGATETAGSS